MSGTRRGRAVRPSCRLRRGWCRRSCGRTCRPGWRPRNGPSRSATALMCTDTSQETAAGCRSVRSRRPRPRPPPQRVAGKTAIAQRAGASGLLSATTTPAMRFRGLPCDPSALDRVRYCGAQPATR
jgi:hypothetical protein